AALVGLALLDEAREGCGRLATLDDAEALHDFRVALRRLRSVLRSFRSELGDAVPKKLQRQLRDVTRATGAARDAEVQLGWVRSHRAELGRRLPPGLPWLLARLAQQQDEAYADIRRTVPGEFRQLARRLHAVALRGSPSPPRARGRRPGPRPASAGLLALARLGGRTQDELFGRLEAEWSAGPLARLTHDARAFADDLAASSVPPP